MSELLDRLQRAIRHDGPMSVATYMAMCLHDREHGYYASRPGLGRDFITAPEVSQVFGELLGMWAVHEWRAMGSPSPFHLLELGPGRGAMMRDMLRAASMFPEFIAAMRLGLVEASPALREEQLRTLEAYQPAHYPSLDKAPDGPAIIIGNEFLDCLPIRQFVVDGDKWRERQVGLGDDGGLTFGLGPAVDPQFELSDQAEVEVASALSAVLDTLAERFAAHPGRALFIDYGPEAAHPGDTLRSFHQGEQVHPLAMPGASDLTADVDCLQAGVAAREVGLGVSGPVIQGAFLLALGAAQRAEQLARANPERADDVIRGVEKLVSPDDMGERFKVICFSPAASAPPAGFEQGERP